MLDNKELRNWQKLAIAEWQKNNYKGIVEVATAGGKTFFALNCIKLWLQQEPESKILIIVPTVALQDQWFVALTEDLKISQNQISIWPENSNIANRFHIMVINTARTKSEVIFKSSPKILLVADECHRYASKENSSALTLKFEATLGLTATAEREYDDGLDEILIPNLGKIIYEYGISDARKDGVVSEFEISNIKVPFKPSEQVEYNKLSRRLAQALSSGDNEKASKIALLRAQVSRNAESRIPAAAAIVEQNKGKRIIVFHEEIEKATLISEILFKRGHSVALYHSQLGGDSRRENLKQFKKGMIEILVCCRALDEGVDVPESEVAIIAASTSSNRQRIQRVGRVIRLHDSKDMAKIFTIYITQKELEKLKKEEIDLASVAKFKWYEMALK